MIEIRWHGRGGQGAFTAARLLGAAASVMGNKYALAFPSFGPERRGAPVLGFTKIDDKRIRNRSMAATCDYIVVLDASLLQPDIFRGLRPGGAVFVNAVRMEEPFGRERNIIAVPAEEWAMKVLQRPIVNVAMMAALTAYTGIVSLAECLRALDREFKEPVRSRNKELFEQVYGRMAERCGRKDII